MVDRETLLDLAARCEGMASTVEGMETDAGPWTVSVGVLEAARATLQRAAARLRTDARGAHPLALSAPSPSTEEGRGEAWPTCKAHGIRWPCAECEKGGPAPAIHLPHNPVPGAGTKGGER